MDILARYDLDGVVAGRAARGLVLELDQDRRDAAGLAGDRAAGGISGKHSGGGVDLEIVGRGAVISQKQHGGMSVVHGKHRRDHRNGRSGAKNEFLAGHGGGAVVVHDFALDGISSLLRENVRRVVAVGKGAPFRFGREAPPDGENVVGARVGGIGPEHERLAGHGIFGLQFESHVRIAVGDVQHRGVFENVGLYFLLRHFDLHRVIARRHDDPFVEGVVVVVGQKDRVERAHGPADHREIASGAFGGKMRNLSLAYGVFAVGFHRVNGDAGDAFSYERREDVVGVIGFQPVIIRDAAVHMCVLKACRAAFQGGYGDRRIEIVDR